ncbi:TSC complex subunit 1b [Poecilia formosa]|uniref:TSC complex subunit 1b n=1 Tax=Poecilia formosa TaxID=48698 RepID=UPI0007B81990|nr:PREDICTED: hamartin [Poecilia formosa]
MAREQPNVGDLLPLLETSDLQQLEEIRSLINEQLSTERGSMLLNGLVDYFLETNSAQALHILSSVREPHDKHLLDKMNDCMAKPACRLPTLMLLGHVVRKQPSWIHKMARYPLLLSLLKCLKTDTDVVVLITGVLVLITLLPMIPQAGKQHLWEYFDIFGRLASWNLKNPGHVSEVYLIHLHASVYSLFHRLYGMYPCNFVSYLRSHYSMKENMETFEEVVKPMLEHVRIHPELVTGTKDHELDPTRWKKYEIHDIVIECAKVSLDPKEASCEEGYATMPENFYPQAHLRAQDSTSSPYTDLHSSYGSSSSTPFSTPRQPLPPPLSLPPLSGSQSSSSYRSPQTSRRQNSNSELNSSCGGKDPLWSPSSLCGMATPPSSRGMSPNLELSHSASHLPSRFHCTSGGKGTPASSTPATSSPPPTLSDDFPVISLPANTVQSSPPRKDRRQGESSKPGLVRQEQVREMEKSVEGAGNRDAESAANVTMTLTELSVFMTRQELDLQLRTEKEREEAAITEELMKLTEDKQELPGLRGYDSPFFHTTETLTGRQTQNPTSSSNAHPGGAVREPRYAASTPDRAESASGGGGAGDRAAASDRSAVDRSWSFQSGFTPIDHHLLRSPSAPDDDSSKFEMFSPSPCGKAPVPYESLFALALPRAASLFVGQKTSEAVHKAAMERLLQREEGLEDGEEEGVVSASPLEVLDRLVQQGSDAHDKVLKRLPLPSKSADWTHFGGSAPLDELHTLRSQLLLLHNQLLYERYKREQHAVRNRRLLRRIINATALEEQNNAMASFNSLLLLTHFPRNGQLLSFEKISRFLSFLFTCGPNRPPLFLQNSNSELNSSCGGKDPLWSPSSLCGMATPPSSRGMSPNLELSHSASHLPSRFHCTSGGKGTPASSTPATSSPPPTLSDDFPVISLPANTVQSSPPRKDRRQGESSKPGLVRQEQVREMEKSVEGAGNRDAESAANVTMTLTELSVFMTRQELDLQLRTEKEREEAAITEELMKLTEDKQELPGLRGYDSPFFHTTETLTGRQTQNPTSSSNAHPGGAVREPRYAASTPDRAESASGGGGAGDRAAASDRSAVDRSWSFQSGFTPIDHHLLRSPSAPDDDSSKFEMFSPSPCGKAPVPYESLFALALPRAASLFVGQKTSEAVHKAAMERLLQREEGLEDGEEEGVVSASPLEVLDRLVQQGSDAHDKVLKRLPLPSKSADWTHFGGSAPLDELHTLRSQLLLLHNQLLYERYKREQHAVRNRRLLRRIINATALEEQNNAMKDQLNLQSVDIVSLRDSLQVEQQRYRQLWDDRETVVTRLHSQIRQLQQSRDDYYTKNQELQSKLQECQKRMDDLEAELQTANNKVGHTGHLLNQMTVKLSNSESSQQQMSFLNKQLLLLGEAHKLSMQDAQHPGMSKTKETEMLRMSHMKEVDSLRQSLLAQGQKLEAAQQRAAELETLLSKKEHLIAEQKKFLEDVKCQAKAELQASDCRFQAQRRVTQLLQTELLQLYSRVEMEAPAAATGSSSPPGGRAETRRHPDCSATAPGGLHAVEQPNSPSPHDSPRGTNGSTLSPGQPKASGSSSPPASSMNGGQDLTPPLLMEPSAPCPQAAPPAALPAADAPLTVGSYPSAKSFLGMKARELFRNKSESQCDDEQPPPRLAGLAHGLKTELCVEPGPAGPAAVTVHAKEPPPEPRLRPLGQGSPRRKAGPGQGGVRGPSGPGRPRQQLKIMDYNETHHEHS